MDVAFVRMPLLFTTYGVTREIKNIYALREFARTKRLEFRCQFVFAVVLCMSLQPMLVPWKKPEAWIATSSS